MSDERASRPRIVEVKRRLDGSEQRFDCELVQRTPSLVVVCFEMQRPAGRLDSYGFFWPRRPYNCYHIVRPESGEAVHSRFDVLRDVDVRTPGEVGYTDLLLDLWVGPDGARWEDEDDVAAAVRSGLLSDADRARIERARAVLDDQVIGRPAGGGGGGAAVLQGGEEGVADERVGGAGAGVPRNRVDLGDGAHRLDDGRRAVRLGRPRPAAAAAHETSNTASTSTATRGSWTMRTRTTPAVATIPAIALSLTWVRTSSRSALVVASGILNGSATAMWMGMVR